MKLHLATALGALLLCLAGPALGQMPKGPVGPRPGPLPDVMPMPKVIDLAINKRATGPVVAGQTATFVLEVSNNGNVTVNAGMGIQVIDPLPAGFSGPMTGFGSPWSCGQVGASLICNWNGGPVAAGSAFPPITVTAVAGDRDSYEQCARVRILRGKDQHPGNDNDCANGRIERPQGGRYDVGIRKDGPSTVPIGQTATFTLQVTNQGPAPVGASVGLTISDLVPVNFTNVTASGVGWNCILAGSQPTQVTCTYTGSQVNAGFQFPVLTITGKVAKEGSWLQCAKVDFKKAEDSNPRDNDDCTEGRAGPGDRRRGYDLGISKTYEPPSTPGGPATFFLYPFNNGPSAVSDSTGVQVTDILPLNFQPQIFIEGGLDWTCAIISGPPWTGLCYYTGPSVGPGPLPPIQILADVGEAGEFNNCARIGLTYSDLNPSDNSGCVDGEVGGPTGKRPDVNISKTALRQPWAWPGGTGVYQFRITNVGDTPVPAGHTFTLTENLPAGMVLVSTPNAWSCSPGAGTVGAATVTCTYVSSAALNPTGFIQFDMTVGFNGDKEPQYTNCASVRVSDRDMPWAEINTDNNSDCEPVEVVWPKPANDMQIQKESNSPVMVGQPMTFVLYPTNLGPGSVDASSGIVVTDTLPNLFTPPVTISAPGWTCPPPTGLVVSCTFTGPGVFGLNQGLPPITLSAVATTAGQTQNCTQIAMPGDTVAANNSACVQVLVRQPSLPVNLEADKEAIGLWPPQVGPGFWFRLSARNTSTNPIPAGTVLTITDNLPAGMRLDSQAGGFTCTPIGFVGPGPVTCTLTLTAPMLPTATEIADIQVSYVGPVQPAYENCITLSASVPETTLDDNSDCATAAFDPPTQASLEIEKFNESANCNHNGYANPCKFRIRISNTGTAPYNGPVTFSDTVTFLFANNMQNTTTPAAPLPTGWTCSASGPPVTCTGTVNLLPTQSVDVVLFLTVTQPTPPIKNCVRLTAPLTTQPFCLTM